MTIPTDTPLAPGSTSHDCWLVEAIIQPFRLDAVILALEGIRGFRGVTVSDCRGFGHEKVEGDREGGQRSPTAGVDFTPKVKLEIVVANHGIADAVADAIARTARTGNPGDGKVFLWPLSRVVRIRTSDEGELTE